ncbi:hypothetical protein GO755_36930 [Spirosoma sp. HMF4905]|uniref:Uncharacterized protein n=1 Tax=Spirosoma arboris TaxID=2682092 RepID=A0A7K1SPD3_9BACT|nr:hypothetical protein [Spirosoma arboris]MVM35659.1 hypothetical protein [Spirosoma arboris]
MGSLAVSYGSGRPSLWRPGAAAYGRSAVPRRDTPPLRKIHGPAWVGTKTADRTDCVHLTDLIDSMAVKSQGSKSHNFLKFNRLKTLLVKL